MNQLEDLAPEVALKCILLEDTRLEGWKFTISMDKSRDSGLHGKATSNGPKDKKRCEFFWRVHQNFKKKDKFSPVVEVAYFLMQIFWGFFNLIYFCFARFFMSFFKLNFYYPLILYKKLQIYLNFHFH